MLYKKKILNEFELTEGESVGANNLSYPPLSQILVGISLFSQQKAAGVIVGI